MLTENKIARLALRARAAYGDALAMGGRDPEVTAWRAVIRALYQAVQAQDQGERLAAGVADAIYAPSAAELVALVDAAGDVARPWVDTGYYSARAGLQTHLPAVSVSPLPYAYGLPEKLAWRVYHPTTRGVVGEQVTVASGVLVCAGFRATDAEIAKVKAAADKAAATWWRLA